MREHMERRGETSREVPRELEEEESPRMAESVEANIAGGLWRMTVMDP